MSDNFLQTQAVTQHFTLGQPRSIQIVNDTIFFVRSGSGRDARQSLWMAKVDKNKVDEMLLVDPNQLKVSGDMAEAEKRRRERLRERGAGITSFSVDAKGRMIVFALHGELFTVDVNAMDVKQVSSVSDAFDPRISPDGLRCAFVKDGSLYCVTLKDGTQTVLAKGGDDIAWGVAEFIAAEEMGRARGFWWSPSSDTLIAAKVDNSPVQTWYISDPSDPQKSPAPIRYPAAGTQNALVELWLINLDTQQKVQVVWDNAAFEYIARVIWTAEQPYIYVQSRDQKRVQLLRVQKSGATEKIAEYSSETWMELTLGAPAVTKSGDIIDVVERQKRQLTRNGKVISPQDLHVQAIHAVDDDSVIFSAWQPDDPKTTHIWQSLSNGEATQLTNGSGIRSIVVGNNVAVLREHTLEEFGATYNVLQRTKDAWQAVGALQNNTEAPQITVEPQFVKSKSKGLQCAVLLPEKYDNTKKLPVIMTPYGGPHAQCVLAVKSAYTSEQWLANQGFAVVIVDGRGTPGRDIAWEKSLAGDIITPVLEDQIEGLQTVLSQYPQLDGSRVGITGWSFGGYLAAYAVVRHPEIFKAAVAGAPVTDWRLYDTHYSERYLGNPAKNSKNYDSCSLINEAAKLQRPLLLVHGFADDNVVFAHTLQFSTALVEAGKPHQVLPLAHTTHMPSDPIVAENLQKVQLEFFKQHLV